MKQLVVVETKWNEMMLDITLGLLLFSVALQAFTIKVFLTKFKDLQIKYKNLLNDSKKQNLKYKYRYIEGTMDFTYQGREAKNIKAIIYPQKML